MKPKTLKPWSFVKNLKYDLSTLKRIGMNTRPEDYYYQLDIRSNIYSPAVLVTDFEVLPENSIGEKK
jgi:hypothetical protein